MNNLDYISINHKLWNKKTEIHFNSEFYDNKSFLKGRDSLNSIETNLLGDIRGKKFYICNAILARILYHWREEEQLQPVLIFQKKPLKKHYKLTS